MIGSRRCSFLAESIILRICRLLSFDGVVEKIVVPALNRGDADTNGTFFVSIQNSVGLGAETRRVFRLCQVRQWCIRDIPRKLRV